MYAVQFERKIEIEIDVDGSFTWLSLFVPK